VARVAARGVEKVAVEKAARTAARAVGTVARVATAEKVEREAAREPMCR